MNDDRSPETVNFYRCKCGAMPRAQLMGTLVCDACMNYRPDRSSPNPPVEQRTSKDVTRYRDSGNGPYPHEHGEFVMWEHYERLTRERDEWAAKWHRLRAELAELKYPGMKGVVRPLSGEYPPSETSERLVRLADVQRRFMERWGGEGDDPRRIFSMLKTMLRDDVFVPDSAEKANERCPSCDAAALDGKIMHKPGCAQSWYGSATKASGELT